MGNIVPARGPLTDLLLAHLRDTLEDFALVGDGIRPDGGGWTPNSQGETGPDEGVYQAYTVLNTGDAALREEQSPPTLRQAMRAWACGYQIDFYGAARAQADDVADATRAAAVSFEAQTDPLLLGGHYWSVQAVRFNRFGGIKRLDNEDPPVWTGSDLFAVWIDLVTPAAAPAG